MKTKEIWKSIPGYEGMYQVSNLGRVKSLERLNSRGYIVMEKILRPAESGNGYLKVCLYKNGIQKNYMIHQLVAIVFLNHTPNGYKIIIDHKDNDKLNNCLDNLQAITQRENSSKDQWRHKKTSKFMGVSWGNLNNKWRADININGKQKYLGLFNSEETAAEAYKNELQILKSTQNDKCS